MNNSINIASNTPPKTSDAVAASNTKNGEKGPNNTETGDTAANAGSFHKSIKKAYDEAKNTSEAQNTDKTEKQQSGNNLPVSDGFSEPEAQDDRSLLPGGLYLGDSKQLTESEATQRPSSALEIDIESIIEDQPVPASTPLIADKKPAGDVQLSETASQLRQLLNIGKNTDTKISQDARIRTTTSSAETTSNNVEQPLIQQAESQTLKTEPVGLTGDKFQALLNTANQQPPSANVQTSLLLQTASAQGDSANDVLPLLTNPLTNNPSTINLQPAIPQAGITEAFGRPAWSQGMGKQILMMVNQNISSAEIRLNPAHLGPIEVLIDMSEEQVSVSMSSRHAMVRDAMEQALPKLREMLEQNGFSLADADISKHSFSEQREQNAQGSKSDITASAADQPVSAEISEQVVTHTATLPGMVDYYI